MGMPTELLKVVTSKKKKPNMTKMEIDLNQAKNLRKTKMVKIIKIALFFEKYNNYIYFL